MTWNAILPVVSPLALQSVLSLEPIAYCLLLSPLAHEFPRSFVLRSHACNSVFHWYEQCYEHSNVSTAITRAFACAITSANTSASASASARAQAQPNLSRTVSVDPNFRSGFFRVFCSQVVWHSTSTAQHSSSTAIALLL